MSISLVPTALSALATRWHHTHAQEFLSREQPDMLLRVPPVLGLDDHMLRDIGVRDGNYCRSKVQPD
jgi:hypothetical protein